MTRNTIILPIASNEQFNRGTSGTPLPSPEPVVLYTGSNQITVNWTANADSIGYRIFYATSPITDISTATRISISDGSTSAYIISGLTNGTRYYVRVVTVGDAGYSALTTEVSAVPTSFVSSYSTQFDGLTEYMHNLATTNFDFLTIVPFSVSMWVKIHADQIGTQAYFIGNRDPANENSGWVFYLKPTGELAIEFRRTATRAFDVRGTIKLTTSDTWIHIVMTSAGTQSSGINFYINSVKDTSVLVSNTFNGSITNWAGITVGADTSGAGNFYEGQIDDISVWDKELSQVEVTEIYNGGTPNNLNYSSAIANLVAWWQMGDSDTATTVLDKYGDADMALVNMDLSNYLEDSP